MAIFAIKNEEPPPLPKWELAAAEGYNKTERLWVKTGWLYRTRVSGAIAMCFVPDADIHHRASRAVA